MLSHLGWKGKRVARVVPMAIGFLVAAGAGIVVSASLCKSENRIQIKATCSGYIPMPMGRREARAPHAHTHTPQTRFERLAFLCAFSRGLGTHIIASSSKHEEKSWDLSIPFPSHSLSAPYLLPSVGGGSALSVA